MASSGGGGFRVTPGFFDRRDGGVRVAEGSDPFGRAKSIGELTGEQRDLLGTRVADALDLSGSQRKSVLNLGTSFFSPSTGGLFRRGDTVRPTLGGIAAGEFNERLNQGAPFRRDFTQRSSFLTGSKLLETVGSEFEKLQKELEQEDKKQQRQQTRAERDAGREFDRTDFTALVRRQSNRFLGR